MIAESVDSTSAVRESINRAEATVERSLDRGVRLDAQARAWFIEGGLTGTESRFIVSGAHDCGSISFARASPPRTRSSRSFKGKLRDEYSHRHVFASIAEAQVVLDAWRDDYNLVRPHSALQDRAPAAVGALW